MMLCGLPGSGKSSVAKRLALPCVTTDAWWDVGKAAVLQRLHSFLDAHLSVVYDACLPRYAERQALANAAWACGFGVVLLWMATPASICLQHREEELVQSYAARFEEPASECDYLIVVERAAA